MKLSLKQKIAFGLGAIGKDMVYALSASYVLYYYQDLLGIKASFVGLILMVARVFDAINDPFMGIVVAKTKTKWGRFRPFADGSVDLDSFEEEANYYVYVFVPQKDDMTTYADEVNATIELLKSEDLNAESVHLIAKDNNKSKGYVFKPDDGAEIVTDLLAHS